jgi:hypothetical protein
VEVSFVVKDLQDAYDRAKIFQTVKLTDIILQPWGVRDFRAVLPDSYYLRVTEPPIK